MHSTYFELYRMRTDRHGLHQKLVAFARTNGIRAARGNVSEKRNGLIERELHRAPGAGGTS